jgi:hypothetical protein
MDIETCKQDAREMANEITKIREEEEQERSIGYTIAKYTVALSPVYIPAILLYIITKDILITVAGTAVFDIVLVASIGLYAISSKVTNKKE